jgi:hypothetical protein
MKLFILMLVGLALVACSTTKVYLYSRYLTDADIKMITAKLKALDFDVESNMLAFPDNVEQSTLLYSPFLSDRQGVTVLVAELAELGWQLPVVKMLVEGNHWYKKDNLALLLLPPGVKRNDKIVMQELVNKYESTHCETKSYIKLNRDGDYQMFFEQSALEQFIELTKYQKDIVKGQWKITGFPYIELKSFNENGWFYFEIQQQTITDKIGEIDIITLKPMQNYPAFPHCSFVYGVRK